MADRPRLLLPAAFTALGLTCGAGGTFLVLVRIFAVSVRYDSAVSRVPSVGRE